MLTVYVLDTGRRERDGIAEEDAQAATESLVIDFDDALDEAELLVDAARIAVESLIEGTLDEPALLAEGTAIEQWLTDNSSPQDKEKD